MSKFVGKFRKNGNYDGDYGYDNKIYQNKRCSRIFKQEDRFDGQAYDVNGKVFGVPSCIQKLGWLKE